MDWKGNGVEFSSRLGIREFVSPPIGKFTPTWPKFGIFGSLVTLRLDESWKIPRFVWHQSRRRRRRMSGRDGRIRERRWRRVKMISFSAVNLIIRIVDFSCDCLDVLVRDHNGFSSADRTR